MKDSEINEYLADLKELTDIESPTSSINGVNEVAAWFKKRAEFLGLKSRSIELGTDKVAPCLFISNDLEATNYDFLFIGHMDTVFPVGTKADVPFKKIDERINALVAIDNKGGSLLSLYVIK